MSEKSPHSQENIGRRLALKVGAGVAITALGFGLSGCNGEQQTPAPAASSATPERKPTIPESQKKRINLETFEKIDQTKDTEDFFSIASQLNTETALGKGYNNLPSPTTENLKRLDKYIGLRATDSGTQIQAKLLSWMKIMTMVGCTPANEAVMNGDIAKPDLLQPIGDQDGSRVFSLNASKDVGKIVDHLFAENADDASSRTSDAALQTSKTDIARYFSERNRFNRIVTGASGRQSWGMGANGDLRNSSDQYYDTILIGEPSVQHISGINQIIFGYQEKDNLSHMKLSQAEKDIVNKDRQMNNKVYAELIPQKDGSMKLAYMDINGVRARS